VEPAAAVQDLAPESPAARGGHVQGRTAPLAASRRGQTLPRLAEGFIRHGCRWLARTRLDLTVEGREHVPVSGPVLIASRHFHHQWDAIVMLAVLPRPPHFLVALDWVRHRGHRTLLEWCCRLLRWPVILRRDGPCLGSGSVYRASDVSRYMRQAVGEAVALLEAGKCLTIFPEAFPNVDSVPTPKRSDEEFLRFRPGITRLASRAQRDPHVRVPIVPAGFEYRRGRRWAVTVRFGPALYLEEVGPGARATEILEKRVRALSGPAVQPTAPAAAEVSDSPVIG
jgi:putative membrane protein